ncbi:hypothetical protein J7E38_17055 [Bacillus sp. ISL-35]|uniref:hypothetical protein n=1 Tax=Bacillus sp. ISL-35 TaxID=2819122 RepID=UPI001BE574C8|nr:hypothetical protein [Bacillus sp. ISL-35]MBT2680721.1 hypothetical protein [Bacillus sp. ISL-35]MBT2702647.1 hypothetical protein [Chryseobacterium sp. ISL-80]
MKQYLKIFVHTEINRVNRLLDEGWELIETSKVQYPDGGEGVEYHLGLPAETRIKQLMEIIRMYEKYGFKSDLIHDFAESKKEDLLGYTTEPELDMPETPVTRFLMLYEEAVNGKSVKYYKRKMHPFEDPELDYIDIDMEYE